MAQLISVSTYGLNGYDSGGTKGFLKGFPVQQILLEQINPTTFSGVVCNSTVTLLPTGLNQQGKKYYTPTALATLITAANA
jgi:hypothetical protein